MLSRFNPHTTFPCVRSSRASFLRAPTPSPCRPAAAAAAAAAMALPVRACPCDLGLPVRPHSLPMRNRPAYVSGRTLSASSSKRTSPRSGTESARSDRSPRASGRLGWTLNCQGLLTAAQVLGGLELKRMMLHLTALKLLRREAERAVEIVRWLSGNGAWSGGVGIGGAGIGVRDFTLLIG